MYKKGRLLLVFIDRGVKINAKYYKEEVWEKQFGETIFASSKTELNMTQ
jgi:hypothetical protein